ncbi:MAG: hypothetical protein VX590_00170 [Chloroflexota bacterium]|nr:hypothetical protein [Chloroflexota bacterium]|tara:strand:- start:4445 stop:4804 length:360 start_codon:yes stop_codon:yes gene_type:complete
MTSYYKNELKSGGITPDESNYFDSGCKYSPTCLNCPLPLCIYDDPNFFKNFLKESRDKNIFKDYKKGVSVKDLSLKYEVSIRTIQRSLKLYRSADIHLNNNIDFSQKIYKKFNSYSSNS